MKLKLEEPESGAVFNQTNGEKVRIEFDRVFTYASKGKGDHTEVKLGYTPDLEIFILEVDFEDFDARYQDNRKAWREYWRAQDASRSLY